jgi:hypothetical protein
MSESKERRVEVGVLGREKSVENEIAGRAIVRGRSAM